MAGSGWIKLHRQFLKWEWWDDHNTAILFIYCLLKANHAPKKWQGITINRGQFVTGRSAMVKETGLSVQSVRTSINRLKSTSEVTIKSTNKFSILTICNWDIYQLDENESNQQTNHPANQQVTSKQPATNQQLTTNKNEKNIKNEKKIQKESVEKTKRFSPPSISEVSEYSKELGLSQYIDPLTFIEFYGSKNWMVGKNKMKNWKMAASRWARKNQKEGKITNRVKRDTEIIVMIRTGNITKPLAFPDDKSMRRYMTENGLVFDEGMNLWMKEL